VSGENELVPTGWHLVNAIISALAGGLALVVGFIGRRLLSDLDKKASKESVESIKDDIAGLKTDLATIRDERKEDSNSLRQEVANLRSEQTGMHQANSSRLDQILFKLNGIK
jgi:hypothetical protein